MIEWGQHHWHETTPKLSNWPMLIESRFEPLAR
jgi:hypothetical protein